MAGGGDEDDIESFDISDNQSVQRASLDDEDFLGSQVRNGPDNAGGVWRKLKIWWYRRSLRLPNTGSFKWQERSIPLYDMDRTGIAVGGTEEEGATDMGRASWSKRVPWRRVVSIILALSLVGIAASLLVSIAKTKSGQGLLSHRFDPYIKYNNGTHDFYPLTVMVSLDGFHPSLISKKFTPFLYGLYTLSYAENITAAPYMLPCFPTQTFPNHWSIVTGKYPRDHRIVSNFFYDSTVDKEFSPGNVDPLLWANSSEPIWQVLQTAFSHGGDDVDWPFKVATHMWPGSDVNFSSVPSVPKERMPFYSDEFDLDESLDDKLGSIVKFMDMDSLDSRPQFILSYVPQIDSFGHKHGYPINSQQEYHQLFAKELEKVDNFVKNLTESIETRNIQNFTNLIIVSDHGMSNIEFPKNVLIWEDLIDDKFNTKRLQNVYNEGPMLAITTVERDDINELKRVVQNSLNELEIEIGSKFKIFLNGNFPDSFNFDNLDEPRIAPIWIIPEPGYAIMTKKNFKNTGKRKDKKVIGSHGYNNSVPEMRSAFIGMGPFFTKGYVKPFENIEIFDMILDIFGVSNNDRFGDNEDTFFYKNFLRNDTIETNVEYLKKIYGSDNAYNELWGDGTMMTETSTSTSTSTTATTGASSSVRATQTSPSSSSSTTSMGLSTVISTNRISSASLTSSATLTSSASSASETKAGNWLEDILEDTKDIIDEIIDDIEDIVKGDNNT